MIVNEIIKGRKRPIRSAYLFPSYDFGIARKIAERIERDGAGSLAEATLAVALGSSAKSSGFRLRVLAAKHFGLLNKRGNMLETTPLAKAIIKPKNDSERNSSIIEAFLRVPLFQEIANRYKGQPLPQGASFRNILERELGIQPNRVTEAERVFTDSCREANMLRVTGNNTYLVTQADQSQVTTDIVSADEDNHSSYQQNSKVSSEPRFRDSANEGNSHDTSLMPNFSLSDLALLKDEDYNTVWNALGKVFRAKGERELQRQNKIKQVENSSDNEDG